MYRLKIILRYLWARRITVIPVLAVAVAVFLLTVVLSVMNGFSAFIQSRMRGLASDLLIEYEDARGYKDYRALEERIRKVPGVEAVSPHVEGKAVITLYAQDGGAFTQPCEFIGINLKVENDVSDVGRMLAVPEWGFAGPDRPWPEELPGLIMGSQVFGRETGYLLGMPASLTTPTATDEDSSMKFRIANLLTSGLHESDASRVYVPLDSAQKLMRMENRIMSFHVRAEEDADLGVVRAALAGVVPPESGFVVKTWIDANRLMIDAMKMERVIWGVILSAMFAVAGFCIMAVMTLTVLQKTRDIGILRSIGASVGGMLSLFVQYGLVVGFIGASIGMTAGVTVLYHLDPIETFILEGRLAVVGLCLAGLVVWCVLWTATRRWKPRLVVHLAIVMIMSIAVGLVVSTECLEHVEQFGRKHMAWTPWPRGVFYFDRIPREMNWPMFWTFWTGGIVVSFLASLVPAARAARTDPVTTLRYQ